MSHYSIADAIAIIESGSDEAFIKLEQHQDAFIQVLRFVREMVFTIPARPYDEMTDSEKQVLINEHRVALELMKMVYL